MAGLETSGVVELADWLESALRYVLKGGRVRFGSTTPPLDRRNRTENLLSGLRPRLELLLRV